MYPLKQSIYSIILNEEEIKNGKEELTMKPNSKVFNVFNTENFLTSFRTWSLKDQKLLESELWREFESLEHQVKQSRDKRQVLLVESNKIFNDMVQNREQLIRESTRYTRVFKNRSIMSGKQMKKAMTVDLNDILQISNQREKFKNIIKGLEAKDKMFQEQRSMNSEKIKYLEQEIELLNEKISLVQNVLKDYYLDILKQGDRIK